MFHTPQIQWITVYIYIVMIPTVRSFGGYYYCALIYAALKGVSSHRFIPNFIHINPYDVYRMVPSLTSYRCRMTAWFGRKVDDFEDALTRLRPLFNEDDMALFEECDG